MFKTLEANLRRADVPLREIRHGLATHYHFDHAGAAQDLKNAGMRLIVTPEQVGSIAGMKTYIKKGSRTPTSSPPATWWCRATRAAHFSQRSVGEIEFAFLSLGGVELMVQPRGDRPADSVALWFYTDRLEEMHAALRKQKAPTGFSRAMTNLQRFASRKTRPMYHAILPLSLGLLLAPVIQAQTLCSPLTGDPSALLHRAANVTGLSGARGRLLHLQGFDVVSNDYQSDRPYPPYISSVGSFDSWFDPATGAELSKTRVAIAGTGGAGPTTLGGATTTYVVRDTGLVSGESLNGALFVTRPLNVWAMLDDWLASPDVRVTERCPYHDFPRTVLTRTGPRGPERLFIDAKSGFPVKVDRVEPHYLWGQVHVEFVYETWQQMGDATLPVAFRLVDGDTKIERVLGPSALAPADSAPRFALPPNAAPMGYPLPGFLRALPPDTIRVGASTFLLRNAGYAETVTLARDTVFVFDATQGDERARQDSAWVGRLFPGHHPIVVVVTDLAWPHVAGVRYWVAMGATIVSHAGSKEFLSQVVVRKWTTPDELERRRMRSRLRFIPVSDTLRLAGGDLLAFTLDGIGSETALAVFDRRDSFLWASDYIQTLQQPTLYLTEVYGAVERVRVAPRQVAAEHLPLSAWSTAAKLIGH